MHVLYLFAGVERKADVRDYLVELAKRDNLCLKGLQLDILRNEGHDLHRDDVWRWVSQQLQSGVVDLFLVAPPCNTHSRVRCQYRQYGGQGHCGTSTFPMDILGSATTTSRRSNWQTIWCRSLFTAVPSPKIMGVISSWSTQSSWVSLLDKYRPAFGIFLRQQSCCVKRVFGLLPFFSASFLRLHPNPRVL